MGERLHGMQEVSGSNPLTSTNLKRHEFLTQVFFVCIKLNFKRIFHATKPCFLRMVIFLLRFSVKPLSVHFYVNTSDRGM